MFCSKLAELADDKADEADRDDDDEAAENPARVGDRIKIAVPYSAYRHERIPERYKDSISEALTPCAAVALPCA